jgi:hypothetical protein
MNYLEETIGKAQVALLRELNVLDAVIEAMPVPSVLPITSEDDPSVMPVHEFVETDIVLTLDSGCCDHILDTADAQGYPGALHPSSGSKRGQRFVVGNGERVPNQGQVRLNMKSRGDDGVLMSSIFQVAEITRPLMSVSKICDQDMICIFEKSHARIVDQQGNTVARFEREGGLYTCTMRLRRPDDSNAAAEPPGNESGFARRVR